MVSVVALNHNGTKTQKDHNVVKSQKERSFSPNFIVTKVSINQWEGEGTLSGITAILPAFNEEVAIGSVVLETKRYAAAVDDGSSDRTAEVATLTGAEVIRHAVNMGKGPVLGAGLEFR